MESVLTNGVLAGFPVLGMKAVLVDGSYHDVDSSVMAFEIAGRAACREGLRKAGARLMEPIMQVGHEGSHFFWFLMPQVSLFSSSMFLLCFFFCNFPLGRLQNECVTSIFV